MLACGVEEFLRGESQGSGVEDAAAQMDERNDEQDLQRVDDVIGKLRRRDVESEGEGQQQAENSGRAEQRVDADEEACGEAPS